MSLKQLFCLAGLLLIQNIGEADVNLSLHGASFNTPHDGNVRIEVLVQSEDDHVVDLYHLRMDVFSKVYFIEDGNRREIDSNRVMLTKHIEHTSKRNSAILELTIYGEEISNKLDKVEWVGTFGGELSKGSYVVDREYNGPEKDILYEIDSTHITVESPSVDRLTFKSIDGLKDIRMIEFYDSSGAKIPAKFAGYRREGDSETWIYKDISIRQTQMLKFYVFEKPYQEFFEFQLEINSPY